MALTDKEVKKLKKEIKELDAERKKTSTGFVRKLSINKKINDRMKLLGTEKKIMSLKQQKHILGLQKSVAKDQAEARELKRKAAITEEDIFGTKELFKI